ncbi:putative nitrate transporter 1.4-like [Capsicum annuum]|nr:putative nitrate transporter 1.4-like [Capsicum annuum]
MARVYSNKSNLSAISSYVSQRREIFTLWMKSLVYHGNGCTVYDSNGQIVYRIDNYNIKRSKEVHLMDSNGKVLFSIRNRKVPVFGHWDGYKWSYDGVTSKEVPWFQVKKIHNVLRGDNENYYNVILGCNSEAIYYKIILGTKSIKIMNHQGRLVAEVEIGRGEIEKDFSNESSPEDVATIASDSQYYASEPTLIMNEPYGYTQPLIFPFDTKKPIATEEHEVIAQKLKSLEQAMRNLQGTEGYKSVSYKDLCMFPDVNLPLDFKIPKFKKYARHDDSMAYLRCYCNQLRAAGGRKELLMAFFGESLFDLSSEWFVDQDIDKWNSWDDLASEFVQYFQYNINLIPDEKSLINMKKKSTEGFREYAIRWREQAAKVKPPMKKSKLVEVFIQAQDETYF